MLILVSEFFYKIMHKSVPAPSFTIFCMVSCSFPVTFGGTLRISYSGGADFFNIRQLVDAGIWPVTMATTLLKPGGYERLSRIAELFEDAGAPFAGIDTAKAAALDLAAGTDPRYQKPVKPLPRRKCGEPLPLIDCFQAPCRTSCPISQDIPGYRRAGGGKDGGRPADHP